MKINFDLLFPDVEIPEDDVYRCTAVLYIERKDLREVLQAFHDERITWSNGNAVTQGAIYDEPSGYQWFEIDCWIGRDGYRDITYSAYPNEGYLNNHGEKEYYLDQVICEDGNAEPLQPLDLSFLYT